MPDLTPEQIAGREFKSAFRGYDPDEVRAFLATLADGLADLLAERDDLVARGTSPVEDRDLKAEFEAVSREVGAVLEAAREAATGLRERAAAESARWRSESLAEAETTKTRAEQDAIQLRSDAWATSEQLLEQCQAEVRRLREQAEADSLRVVGEAEREAHRLTANARREADDTVRAARMEAERLSTEAKTRHDEIIATAMRQSEAAQERTRALEERRMELMRELESVRATLTEVEGELDQRRERLGFAEPAEEPVGAPTEEPMKVVEPESWREETPKPEGPSGEWVPGETVRVVRPARPAPGVPVSIEPEPEFKVLSADELAELRGEGPPQVPEVEEILAEPGEVPPEGPHGAAPVPDEAPVDVPEPVEGLEQPAAEQPGVEAEEAVPEAEEGDHRGEESAGEAEAAPGRKESPASEPAVSPVPSLPAAPADAVEETALPGTQSAPRVIPAAEVPGHPAAASTEDDESPALGQTELFEGLDGLFERLRTDEGETVGPVKEPESPERPDPHSERRLLASMVDPFELRDRLLLPVGNRALRNLKRQLTDEQNLVLEEIRLDETGWTPNVASLRDRVRADLVVLHAESFGAGHSGAEELLGGRIPRPATPRVELAEDFAEALGTELTQVVTDGRNLAMGARQMGAALSRIFRAWRTDHAERRVREIALAAYHEGLVRSVELSDGLELRWVVGGRRCATCRAAAEQPLDELPPAHSGCECTISP